jgi:bacillithiol synthase
LNLQEIAEKRWPPLVPSPELHSGPVSPQLLRVLAANLSGPVAGAAHRDLEMEKARVVITGQQPCFPFPLGLTLMKIATTIAVAADLTDRTGIRHIPVFWSGGDDSDFNEARGQWVHRPGRDPFHVALGREYHRKGSFVGDLDPLPAWRELVRILPGGGDLERWEPLPGEDLGQRECRILGEIFAQQGLLTLDARDTAVREAAGELYMRYCEKRDRFTSILDRQGDSIKAETGLRPLRTGLGERALFFLKRGRRVLPLPEVYGRELKHKLRVDPLSLSPNAALRPLVQDSILPVAAVVLGPSEWRYHRQLRPVFDLLEVPFPPACPRLEISLPDQELAGMASGGRDSSPLSVLSHPLADPELLVAAAVRHGENLQRDSHFKYILRGG